MNTPDSPLRSHNVAWSGRKSLPSLFVTFLIITTISIYVSTINQFHLFSIDKSGSISIDYDNVIHSMISGRVSGAGGGDDDEYLEQFESDDDDGSSETDVEYGYEEKSDEKEDDDGDDSEDDNKNDTTDANPNHKEKSNNGRKTVKKQKVEGDDDDGNDDKDPDEADELSYPDKHDDGKSYVTKGDDNTTKDAVTSGKKKNDQPVVKEEEVITRKKNDDKPMNVLILYPDDWRHDTIGSEKPYVLTPFLDQLAKEGIRFTHNAVTTSVCWMSRATLWMGQLSSRHKSYRLKCPRFGTDTNWEHSWVRMLQKAGYFIGHIGKWQYYTRDTKKYFSWSRLFEGHHWETVFGGRVVHASDLAKEYAFTFFDERPKDKPFVLSIAFYPPKPVGDGRAPGHQFSPTNETKKLYENVTIPRPEFKESYNKLPEFLHKGPAVGRYGQRYGTEEHFQASMRNYYALVTGVDQACKEIVDRLKAEGLYNNTMIIFTTDNGMFHGAHGLAGKWYPYQESIRVPLIIHDPRMPSDKVGTLDDSFTLNVDLAQTILGAAGVKPDELMQGRDISDLYLPNKKSDIHNSESIATQPWRDEFFYEYPSFEEKWIPSSTALVRKDWKYIFWTEHKWEQLFNLEEDPLENNDLYGNEDAKVILEEMRERHNKLRDELHDPTFINDTESCLKFHADLWNEHR